MAEQVLDSMDLERERGITIKAQSVTLKYPAKNGEIYELNFIDTPGHVDFSYEVSRSLAACEGALLVVDAAQGVEAQSVANCYTAIEQGLEVIPVLNKIDLPSAEPERVINEIEEIIGIEAEDALRVSAKTGIGIEDLLEQLVELVPPPGGDENAPLQALIVDSWFDPYVGVISLIRVVNGSISKKDKITVMSTGRTHQVDNVGIFTPKQTPTGHLGPGEVGFLIAGIKEIDGAPVGDTVTLDRTPCEAPLPGFQQAQPRVFAGLFPVNSEDYESFREALQKLKLNDAALHFEPETSTALGFGFRCGFLGLLHLEVIRDRLERELDRRLGTVAADLKLWDEAEKALAEARSMSPGSFLPHFSLGALAALQDKHVQALAHLEAALEHEQAPQALYLKGTCHLNLGQTGKAISFAQQTPFTGRPLWPCPGMGPLVSTTDEK